MNRRLLLAFLAPALTLSAPPPIVPGDLVRLTRSETLLFQGKDFVSAPKEEEFTVLKHDATKGLLFVGYHKDDGTLIAVSAPAAAFEPCPPDAWADLLAGAEAFRDQRTDEARRRFARAAQDDSQRQLATTLAQKLQLAAASPAAALPALRDLAAQLAQSGQLSLALALDLGADRLGAAPPTKLDRADLGKRAAASSQALGRCRQLVAQHKLAAAKKLIAQGLQAEPGRPELKRFEAKVDKDIAEADEHHRNANRMRNVPKGTVHALTAIEMGLKLCADHPKLRALKAEMQSAFEERTSPPVTAAFLAAAGAGASKDALTEGHKIYTTRCTECHDLELLDSRSMAAWRTIVGGMSRRAKIDDAQQERILAYLAVAQRTMDSRGE